jgi:hypothetical protein
MPEWVAVTVDREGRRDGLSSVMGPIGFLARAQLRRRWLALTALAVLVGALGGLTIALVAGARRSASVVDRYFAAGIPYDLAVAGTSLTRSELLDLPGVVRADPRAYVAMMRLGPTGTSMEGINGNAVDWASVDPTVQILDGAVPDGSDPFEAMVNEAFVELTDAGVGDDIDVRLFGLDQLQDVEAGNYVPTGPRHTFRIAGVVQLPVDIAVDEARSIGQSAYVSTNLMLVSHEFYERHRDTFLQFGQGYDIQVSGGPGAVDDFTETIEALARERGESAQFDPPRFQDRRLSLESPVGLETNALLLLGLGIAVAGTVTIALLLRADQRSHDHEEPILRALGFTSRQLGATAMIRTVPVSVGGAVLAMVVGVALSARFPVAIGRELELDPGLAFDAAVVGLGGLFVVLVVTGLSYLFGRAAPRRDRTPRARSTLAGRLAGAGAPTEAVIGTQFAFAGGHGSGPTSRRAGIVAGASAVAVVAAIGLYVAGVDRLYSVPTARGWAWDGAIGNVNFPLAGSTIARLEGDPRIEATPVARVCQASVDGEVVEVLAVRPDGTAPPVLRSGRLPASASEIALGTRLGRTLAVGVGDLVTFSVAGGECEGDDPAEVELTVVGVAVPPVLGETDIGHGAVVSLEAIAAAGGDDQPQLAMVRFSGDDPAAVGASLDRDLSEEILTDSIPAEVANLYRVRPLPLIGVALAGILGTIVLAYTLTVGQRGQLRDIAVMRSLGLSPRQLRRVMTWQGVVLVGTMMLVGLPLGMLAGRMIWRRFAEGLGVDAGPVTPWVLLMVPLGVAVAIIVTRAAARRARWESVASLLRAE